MSQFFVDSITNPIPILDDLIFLSAQNGTTAQPSGGVIQFSGIGAPNNGTPFLFTMSGSIVFGQFQVAKQTPDNGGTDLAGQGIAMFFNGNFSVDSNTGFVSAFCPPNTYTNVTSAMSPYTVAVTDGYISCDTSAGPITLNFPNSLLTGGSSTSQLVLWQVKDRTGNAVANNITLTSTGGVVTFDGAISRVINTNYGALGVTSNKGASSPYTPAYELY